MIRSLLFNRDHSVSRRAAIVAGVAALVAAFAVVVAILFVGAAFDTTIPFFRVIFVLAACAAAVAAVVLAVVVGAAFLFAVATAVAAAFRIEVSNGDRLTVNSQPSDAIAVPLRVARLDDRVRRLSAALLDPALADQILGDALELIVMLRAFGVGERELEFKYIWHVLVAVYMTQRCRVTGLFERRITK